MSELTKRLRIPYEPELADYLLMMSRIGEAADRIDKLEECLREIVNSDMAQMAEDEGRVCKELNKARALLGEK